MPMTTAWVVVIVAHGATLALTDCSLSHPLLTTSIRETEPRDGMLFGTECMGSAVPTSSGDPGLGQAP